MARKTNVEVNDNKYFRVRVKVGVDADGKDIIKAFYGKSKTEAEEKRDEYLEGIKKGLGIDYDKATFGDLFKDWLFIVVKPNVSLSTFERYEATYRLAIKESNFYNVPIITIKSIVLQKFYNEQNESNGPYRVERIHGLLSSFFDYCITEKIMVDNPTKNLKLPKIINDTTEKKYMAKEDISKLLKAFNNDFDNLIYIFALYTGLRQGEIFALTHKDINLDDSIVSVNKSIKRVTIISESGKRESKMITKTPKNQSSIRKVPLADKLIQPLKIKMTKEKEKHLKLGIPFSEDSLLFSSNQCTPLRSDHVGSNWKKLLKDLHIKYVKFHGLRHTFGTLLAEQGVPLKTASKLMGHKNINTTAKIYIHVDESQKKSAIKTLDEISFN
jgi:integrase